MKLSTFEEQLLFTTLRIELLDNDRVVGVGTGFLVSRETTSLGIGQVFLVSNKHVLQSSKDIRITFTRKDMEGNPDLNNTFQCTISNSISAVIAHPSQNVDVAVLLMNPYIKQMPDNVFIKHIGTELFATFNEEFLTVAQSVLFVGYPDGRFDYRNNLPLIRTGLIASHPKVNFNGEPVFIIDAQVFQGSSGSPVLVNLSFEHRKTGSIIIGNKQEYKLLGVVAQTMVRENQLVSLNAAVSEDDKDKKGIKEIIGLGIVYKATTIMELLNTIPK